MGNLRHTPNPLMNFDPQLSTPIALFFALTAAAMWGSWFISLKYLGEYPLDGFMMTLFTTSLLFVWGVGFALDGPALVGDMARLATQEPLRIVGVLIGGITYVGSIRFTLSVIRTIGLSLMQPIQSSLAIMMGTFASVVVGGMPASLTIERLVLACGVLIAAVFVSMLAGYWRDYHNAANPDNSKLWRALGLVLLSTLFTPAYPLALSYGLRSSTQPEGLSVLPFMALLCTGAFVGACLTSGLILTKNRQWGVVRNAGWRIHRWGILSGLFHYGGNILHSFATAHLSSALSWPLGVSSGFWTLMWGLVYGEFRHAPRRAYAALLGAMALYVFGVYLIAGGAE